MSHSVELPHPVEAVLGQYVDLEHIEHLHPSLGRYELLEANGHLLRYVQVWPTWLGWTARSVIEQVHVPPDRMDFRFVGGMLRGVEVLTTIRPLDGGRTRVDEVYMLPWLPPWRWLAAVMAVWIRRDVRRIWDEDLAVGLPRGGWPGMVDLPDAPPATLADGERRCPHAGGPLRRCADATWRCPWHGAAFDARGRRVRGPGPDQADVGV